MLASLLALLQFITPRATTSGRIWIFPDSMMVGTVISHGVRKVPELPDVPSSTAFDASDQLYQTLRSYRDTVVYFDQQFRRMNVIARSATQTSTAWHIQWPDGKPATLVVRNTTPTSFEVIEAVERGTIFRERGRVEQHESHPPD
jgi:hypothetical protein